MGKKIKILTKNDRCNLNRIFKYIVKFKVQFAFALICMMSIVGLNAFQPMFWGKMLENVYTKKIDELWRYLVIVCLIIFLRMVLKLIENYLTLYLTQNIYFNLKRDIFTKVLNITTIKFNKMRTGDFMNKLIDDVFLISSSLTNQILQFLTDFVQIIVIGIIVFKLSFPLAIIVVLSFPISQTMFIITGIIIRKKQEKYAKLSDDYYSFLNESISGIREIKTLGQKKWRLNKFIDIAKDVKSITISKSMVQFFGYSLSQIINTISQLVIIIVGAYLIFDNVIKIDIFIAFTLYSVQFSMSLVNITKINTILQQMLTSLERIYLLMDEEEEKYGFLEKDINYGKIEFKNVFFDYSRNNECNTIKDISFKIKPNSINAIVGYSGSGKTTILNLILKLYDVKKGEILIDDVNISDYTEKSIRNGISVVNQESFLFNISIYDNLLMVNPSKSSKEIIEACNLAYINDFIMSLPNKYNTIVGEKGVNLSGGQKQRLAIARTILSEAKIIVFDEATSALDNESQNFIKKTIKKLAKNCTIIVVAHRLSTVIESDNILVLSKGEIVGSGNHNNLINENLIYKDLYKCENELAKSYV